MNKIWLVASREWKKIVSKPAFWASVILLPIFMVVVSLISGYSSSSLEKKLTASIQNATHIIVVDQSGIVPDSILQKPLVRGTDTDAAIAEVKAGTADAAIIYPADVATHPTITIAAKDEGIIGQSRYNGFAQKLLQQAVTAEIPATAHQALLTAAYSINATSYANGQAVDYRWERLIVPIASVAIYFLLVIMVSSFMLMSVSEEKENRIIETLLTLVSPKELIWGKIIGLTLVGFTQLAALGAMIAAAAPFALRAASLTIDWSALDIHVGQILFALYFIVTGFIFLASIMVGVGSAMPTYKEAQSFSSIFIILSIFPIYFATALIADPTGIISQITSYTPFTAQLVLLFRNAINAISWWELLLGMTCMLVYCMIGFWLAFRLFAIGSLEYGKKISFKSILRG